MLCGSGGTLTLFHLYSVQLTGSTAHAIVMETRRPVAVGERKATTFRNSNPS